MMHVRNLAPPTRLHVHKLLDRLPSLITSRFFSASPSDVFSFGHVDRTVTLELRGLPPLSKARKHKREYASNKRVVDAAVSALPNCDFVALGLGSPELGVISRYLHFRDSKNGDTARRHKFKNERQLLSGYQQYIDVVVGAASAGTKVIGIGRSKQAEAASFGEAAMGNKLEVLRLLSLYLRKGDVLNGEAR
ncbi:undecaprenyl-phosphate glucose phosphotransferase [Babesia caballi]|uniref:Undecaprenyl-phosphate glucose phosphotransferase n=1 Tax=Babesia caballi TaxID=5871 RepID=A0AAV4M072_BABCB|nr:undecaprenyl-phosphate glucose phosphotransferase [Babesia caballi]